MRLLSIFFALALVSLTGCSTGGPATPPDVTPEMLAKQKAAEEAANNEEATMQKQTGSARPTNPRASQAEEEERAMQGGRRR
jgi:predicted small lipoprotein YifL